jgi:peptide deformylase
VGKLDHSIKRLIADLFDSMHEANGLGLAAIQIGVPLRVAVIQLPNEIDDEYAGKLLVLRNPEIIKTSGECVVEEGCLSIPGYVGDVKRAEQCTVRARDENGKEIRIRASGLLAQALQHEIDHMDGILYIDYLPGPDALRPARPASVAPDEPEGVPNIDEPGLEVVPQITSPV